MKTTPALALVLLLALIGSTVSAEKDKNKNKSKEKRYEPIAKLDAHELAGRYVGIEPTHYLDITVGENGQMQITSFEGKRRAELVDMVVDGPRLQATLAYEDGSPGKFDGVFADRILNGQRDFGVLVRGIRLELEDLTFDQLFYRFVGKVE
jgi:hypothetical protein